MEHGEDPYDTVRREVTEETGYRIEVTGLLGVDSRRHLFHRRGLRRATAHHALRLVYEGEVVGGELRYERGGSTDFAAWQDLSAVPDLNRVRLVDVALRLWRERPAHGHPAVGARPLPQEMNEE
jgi:8-oxo-dGTP diphosphatase